jgi:hypothetical protein
MFCSGCGQALTPGQGFCPQCGRPVAPPAPPVPGYQFELEGYAGKLRVLAILWFVYAGLSLLMGFAGLAFLRAFFMGDFGPWMHMHGPPPPVWVFPALIHVAWIFISLRAVLAVIAGWGLLEHTHWGRIVAIVAAFLCLIRFPLGTALGIWTLVMLLGYRNSTLYQQLGNAASS